MTCHTCGLRRRDCRCVPPIRDDQLDLEPDYYAHRRDGYPGEERDDRDDRIENGGWR